MGAALYAINLAVGLCAQVFRTRFGAFHHWLYALVFVTAAAATVLAFHPALLVTLAALLAMAMPLTKPGTALHPSVALIGACGYLATYLWN